MRHHPEKVHLAPGRTRARLVRIVVSVKRERSASDYVAQACWRTGKRVKHCSAPQFASTPTNAVRLAVQQLVGAPR